MTASSYFTEAKKAQETLNPLLSQALQEARNRMERAKEAAQDARREDLIASIEAAPLLDESEAMQIISSLASDMPPKEARSGERLVFRPYVNFQANVFNFADCQKAAQAIVMGLQEKIPPGLIRWPSWNWFKKSVPIQEIERFCSWVAPERYQQIQAARRQAQEEKAQAERELAALEKAQESLQNLIPEEVTSNA